MIVAHRGASRDAPGNTIPAFELAWKQGADAIEGDFHLTKDGQIVCIHDDQTGRVANRNLVVGDSTLAELRDLDVGLRHGRAFAGTTIPTLAEVLATIPDGKRIYIEIKCGPEIIPTLLDEIKTSGLKNDQIVVICFSAMVLKTLKEQAPEITVSWLGFFEKDKATGEILPSLETVLDTLDTIKANGFSSDTSIPKAFVAGIQEHGYDWHVWTINDLKTARVATALGAASITTDTPARIRNGLAAAPPTAE